MLKIIGSLILVLNIVFPQVQPLLDANSNTVYVICSKEGANLYNEASDDKSKITSTVNFSDEFCIIQEVENDGYTFYEVGDFEECNPWNATSIGWIKSEDVMHWSWESDKDGNEYYASDGYIPIKEDAIMVKGLIKTSMLESDIGKIREGAKRYTKPFFPASDASDDFLFGDDLTLDEIYYVYKQESDDEGNKWYLLGRYERIIDPFRSEETLLGWVEDDRVFIWNTRNAYEFDKTALPYDPDNADQDCNNCRDYARVFVDKSSIEEVMLGANIDDYTLLKETDSKTIRPDDSRIYIREKDWVDGGDKEVFNIGMFASAFLGGGNMLSDVHALTDHNMLDILFVYDGTASMRDMRGAVQTIVQNAQSRIETIWENDYQGEKGKYVKPQIRCSIAMYRDGFYVEEINGETLFKESYDYFSYKPLGDISKSQDLVTFMENHNFEGGCYSPSTLNGIATSIEYNKEYFDKKAIKVMILIGDMGHHFLAGQSGVADRFSHSFQSIAQSLDNDNIIFYAINVVEDNLDNFSPQGREWTIQGNQLFKSDYDNIFNSAKSINPDRESLFQYHTVNNNSTALNNVLDQIVSDLGMVRFEVTNVVGDAVNFGSLVNSGGAITTLALRLMKDNGIDINDFIKNQVPPFIDDAYIFEKNPFKPDENYYKNVLFLSRNEIVKLHALYSKLTETYDRANIESVWTSTLGSSIGEEVSDDDTYHDKLLKYYAIPTYSPLLSKSLNEIRRMNNKDFFREMEIIRQKVALLWSVLDEREIEIITDDNGVMIEQKTIGNKEYFFGGHGNKKCWLDAEVYIP